MKKYLMTVMAAVTLGGLFAGCSKDADLNGGENSVELSIVQNYEEAFVTRFGEPAENQTWGFGEAVAGTRSGNTNGDYTPWPYTHGYYDADSILIASANMNHNQWGSTDLQSMPFGGWIVPDPLTDGQKLRVQKYFQSHPNLSYEDPCYANFFVQQVYTGGSDAPETGNHEVNVAADGTPKKGSSLNQLTVGVANSHINDFNAGTCTTSSVLNHEGKTQSDQITLMLNVDDTSCFGYHETSGSNVSVSIQHNDRMALVSAADIDAWGDAEGIGEKVDDKWHRSFMGFDYEMLPQEDVIVPNTYAMLNQVQNINNCQYAVYNGTVMKIGQNTGGANVADLNITNKLADKASSWDALGVFKQNGSELSQDAQRNWLWDGQNFTLNLNQDVTNYKKLVIEFAEATPKGCNFQVTYTGGSASWNQNLAQGITKVEVEFNNVTTLNKFEFQNGSGSGNFKIKNIYLTSGANEIYYDSAYLLAGTEQIPFYSTNTNMYGGEKITLTDSDFYKTVDNKKCLNLDRIKQLYDQGYRPIDTALWNWVKYVPVHDNYYSDWIVTLTKAERITPTTPPVEGFVCRIIAEDLTVGENSDFDFNDVVFDVIEGGTKLRLRAAGGELPLYVAGQEVHDAFATKYSGITRTTLINTGRNGAVDYENYYVDIPSGGTYNTRALAESIPIVVHKKGQEITLTAKRAKVASKVAVGSDYKWCSEREDIDRRYRMKNGTKLFHEYVVGHLGDDWVGGTAWYQQKDK